MPYFRDIPEELLSHFSQTHPCWRRPPPSASIRTWFAGSRSRYPSRLWFFAELDWNYRDFAQGVAGTVSLPIFSVFFFFRFLPFFSVSTFLFACFFRVPIFSFLFLFFRFLPFSSVFFSFLLFHFQKNGETPFARPFCETPKLSFRWRWGMAWWKAGIFGSLARGRQTLRERSWVGKKNQ